MPASPVIFVGALTKHFTNFSLRISDLLDSRGLWELCFHVLPSPFSSIHSLIPFFTLMIFTWRFVQLESWDSCIFITHEHLLRAWPWPMIHFRFHLISMYMSCLSKKLLNSFNWFWNCQNTNKIHKFCHYCLPSEKKEKLASAAWPKLCINQK